MKICGHSITQKFILIYKKNLIYYYLIQLNLNQCKFIKFMDHIFSIQSFHIAIFT
jgi:hypothetical protein